MLGKIVLLRLTAEQAAEANSMLIACGGGFRGNCHREGEQVPMVVVRDWGGSVNGRALLDGEGDLWIPSAVQGSGLGQWMLPEAS